MEPGASDRSSAVLSNRDPLLSTSRAPSEPRHLVDASSTPKTSHAVTKNASRLPSGPGTETWVAVDASPFIATNTVPAAHEDVPSPDTSHWGASLRTLHIANTNEASDNALADIKGGRFCTLHAAFSAVYLVRTPMSYEL